MEVLCIRNVCASGQALESGKIYNISDIDAEFLIKIKKAEKATVQKSKKTKVKNANN
tara:strand:- start:309 stop:479 length:171 start_codon:yes stop_codon:yes gene_type:complete